MANCVEVRKIKTNEALGWLGRAWNLFKLDWEVWLLISITTFLIWIFLNLIPILGTIAAWLLWPFWIAGPIAACDRRKSGRKIQFKDLFLGFEIAPKDLMLLAAITIMLGIVLFVLAVVLMFIFIVLFMGLKEISPDIGMAVLVFGALFLILLMLSIGMMSSVTSLAITPIVLNRVPVIDALYAAFKATIVNLVSLTVVYLFYFLIFSVVIIFTLGLGFFVMKPLFTCLVYITTSDIFSYRNEKLGGEVLRGAS